MAGDGESADDGENDEAKDVVNHGSAEDDAGFIGTVLAQVAENAGGDADAGGGKDAADEEVGGKRIVGTKKLHGEHAESHGDHDAENGDDTRGFADALHFDEGDFKSDEKEKNKDGEAGDDVNEGVNVDVGLALRAAEQRSKEIGVRTGRKDFGDGFTEAIRASEGDGRNFGEVIAFAEDREGGIAEVVAEIAGEKSDEEFAKNGGLLDPLHERAADGGAEGDEDGSDEDGDDRVGVRKFATSHEDHGAGD